MHRKFKINVAESKMHSTKKRPRLKDPTIDWNKKGVTCGPGDSQIDSDLKT